MNKLSTALTNFTLTAEELGHPVTEIVFERPVSARNRIASETLHMHFAEKKWVKFMGVKIS